MEEMTVRRFQLGEKYKEIENKSMISMKELIDLMDQVHKLLMNYDEAVKSRDSWKKKFEDLRKEVRK